MKFDVIIGDITKFEADAIVNAANVSLLGGGGVDGAIHRAAGLGLLKECAKLCGCRTGQAKITDGYKLPAKHIIHTPGPMYFAYSKQRASELLRDCYVNSLNVAEENDCRTVGFASISTGIYRFPLDEAAAIVAQVLSERASQPTILERVTMVCFDPKTAGAYEKAFANVGE